MSRAKSDIEVFLNEEKFTMKQLNETVDLNLRILKEDVNSIVICLLCDKVRCAVRKEACRIINEMRNHVDSHIDDLHYLCTKCDKVYKTRGVYYCHMAKVHSKNKESQD